MNIEKLKGEVYSVFTPKEGELPQVIPLVKSTKTLDYGTAKRVTMTFGNVVSNNDELKIIITNTTDIFNVTVFYHDDENINDIKIGKNVDINFPSSYGKLTFVQACAETPIKVLEMLKVVIKGQ